MQQLALCLGAADPALSASAAASLGLVSLQSPLPLPPGDLKAVEKRWGTSDSLQTCLNTMHLALICRVMQEMVSASKPFLPLHLSAIHFAPGSI